MSDAHSIWSFLNGTLLLMAAFSSIALYRSFSLAGDAGVARFLEKYPPAARYQRWTKRWPLLCATLLMLSATLIFAAISTLLSLVEATSSPSMAAVRVALLILAFLIACHILPIAVAESFADRIAITFLPAVVVATVGLYPLALIVEFLERRLKQLLLSQSADAHRPSSEDEIISVVDHADADDLEESEREMIRSVLEFGDTVTREIMTHRVDIVAFEHSATIAECAERSKSSAFSRFPVYANSLDDIRGVVHVKDLLKHLSEGRGNQAVASLCNKVTFVPETMPIDDLFHLLRTARAQLALVVDEYGGTAGLVSMEDIIEELVGEIHDEYDQAENAIQPMPDGSYLVDAREPVYEVNETLGITLPESEEYDSVGGYIFHKLGQIPGPGERIEHEDFELRIQTAVPNRIVNVRIIKHTRNT